MRPSSTPSAFFSADQDWIFKVRSWDTPQTVIENDVASSGMQLRVFEPIAETTNWTAYATAVKAVAAGSSVESAFTSATYATPTVADGRWPLVQAYWGSGTPNWWGGTKVSRVAVCYTGTLVPTAQRTWLSSSNTFTFALAGSGWARIDVVESGTTTTLFTGDLSESMFLSDGFQYSTTRTLANGAQVKIYYIQTGNDPWGGLVVKAIAGTRPGSTAALKTAAQTAPVVSAGLFSQADVAATELPYIMSVTVTQEPGAATRAEIEVPLINPSVNDGHGWAFYQQNPATDPGVMRVYDGGQLAYTLKRKRLIQVLVARKSESPQWTPIFTGHVDDFGSGSAGRLSIQSVSFEGRLVEQFEQAPDRISYMARGFQVLDYAAVDPSNRKQPVYNVPGFDNWPLSWAIEELGTRAGLDPSVFRKSFQAVNTDGSGQTIVLPDGSTAQRFQALSLSGEKVRLPRPVHYGNVGLSFTENRPYDDTYLFKIEPTKDLWARARELADRLGYVCRFDMTGAAILYPAASPTFVADLSVSDVTSGTMTAVINPAAYGAKYLTVATNTAATIQKTVKASRIDVSFPRSSGARPWTVTVTPSAGGAAVATTTVTPTGATATPVLFFDAAVTAPGGNSTVTTVYSGDYAEYVVTLTCASASGVGAVDCVIAYGQDPDSPKLPALSTLESATSVSTKAQQDAVRNKITIVGRRKGAVTDSDKFAEAQAPTEQEYVVQNAVDVNSITNPSANNYVGYLKQSVIYDESIADDGLARYLAQVFIYRQSVPRAGTSVTHTLLPMLEPGDPVSVEETKYDTVSASTVQYTRKVTHTINTNRFQTSIETEAWPNYPAYQPRTDIVLSDFDNKPVVNLSIGYTSLSGHSVQNPGAALAKLVEGNTVMATAVAFSGANLTVDSGLPWPPVPGTVQVEPNYTRGNSVVAVQTVTAYTTVSARAVAGQRIYTFDVSDSWDVYGVRMKVLAWLTALGTPTTLLDIAVPSAVMGRTDYFYYEEIENKVHVYRGTKAFTFNASAYIEVRGDVTLQYQPLVGDGRQGWLSNHPYHRFIDVDYKDSPTIAKVQLPWAQANDVTYDSSITSFNLRYRSLFPDTNKTDRNGTVSGTSFSPFYDPYTSELGNLVSVTCSVLAEGLYRVSIRNWDDDTVVAWMTNPAADPMQKEQHWEYLPVISGKQFTWDGVDQVGAWNAVQSEMYAQLVEGSFTDGKHPRIGRGFYCWNQELSGGDLGPLAYIWMQRNADGTPVIGHGTFARWYVHIEAQTTTTADTEVSSRDDDLTILTHLPEPTKLELKIHDYVSSAWTTPDVNVGEETVGAYINNAKPVRLRFKVGQRPGALWANNQNEVAVKLTREVHLRAMIGDQSVVFNGKEFAGTTVEDRAIYNRRLINDEHTNHYTDTGYRKAKTFRWDDNTDTGDAVTEWVFTPADFKRTFRLNGLEESVAFGDYLQLEEVPAWNGNREVSAARSRLHFALMSYLFYLSGYVTDRSGRSSWGINRSFVDKSKIPNNGKTLDWPTDPMYEQRRTVVCRQWTQESAWKAAQLSTFGYAAGTLFDKLLQHFWHQHDITSTQIGTSSPANWSSFGLPSDRYAIFHTGTNTDWPLLPSVYSTSSRMLGSVSSGNAVCHFGNKTDTTTSTGSWNWETSPMWLPSITRDLHPFFMLPPMISPARPTGSTNSPGLERDYRTINFYWTVGGPNAKVAARVVGPGGMISDAVRETTVADAAGAQTWSSPVTDFLTDTLTGVGATNIFWPGQQVNVKDGPYKDHVTSAVMNYVRQDEMVHFEDLRGIFSRGKFPVGQSVKVAPSGQYYFNPHKYTGIEVYYTLGVSSYPQFHMLNDINNPGLCVNWFRTAFRSEYVWESGSMFPTTLNGRERLDAVLWWRHRFLRTTSTLFYDYGAWTGWKDDLDNSGTLVVKGGMRTTGNDTNVAVQVGSPFATGFMPVGVGPRLPQTVELVSHLVLVPERRGTT